MKEKFSTIASIFGIIIFATVIAVLVNIASNFVVTGGNLTEMSDEAHFEKVLEDAGFKPVPDNDYLYYSEDTKIIYYIFGSSAKTSDKGYGFMTEYIDSNGKPCKFVDYQMVEITEEDTN